MRLTIVTNAVRTEVEIEIRVLSTVVVTTLAAVQSFRLRLVTSTEVPVGWRIAVLS